MSDDVLTLLVQPPPYNGAWTSFTGWENIVVSRSLDSCPSQFMVEATARSPQGLKISIGRGWRAQILLGADVVLSGYIDRVSHSLTPDQHSIQISGRSKCEDLVDCSAAFSTFQLNSTNPLAIAQTLVKPFGITVSALGDIGTTAIQQFGVILTETSFEILGRVARYAGLLVYDGTDGNLILSRAGSEQMASGFSQGVNIQSASADFSMDQRFSTIEPVLMSTATLLTAPGEDGLDSADALASDLVTSAMATDPNVPRYRPLLIIADQNDLVYKVAQQEAQWEVNWRMGRSNQIHVTVDSWRDSAGALWEINTRAPVDIPAFGVNNVMLLIMSVTFRRGLDSGTLADLVLMPPEAALVEPIVLTPLDASVAQAMYDLSLQNGGAASTDGFEASLAAVNKLPTGGASK